METNHRQVFNTGLIVLLAVGPAYACGGKDSKADGGDDKARAIVEMAQTLSEPKATMRYPVCANYLDNNGRPQTTLFGPVPFPESVGASFNVYSLPGYRRNDLGSTGWVAVVARDEPNPGTSKAFPPLGPGDIGCVLFHRYRDHVGDTISVAGYVAVPGNPIPWKLPAVAVCEHKTEILDGRKPDILSNAGDCKEPGDEISVSLSFPSKPVVSLLMKTDKDSAGLRASLKTNKSATMAFSQAEIDDIVKRYGEPGPWFPCSSSDCCRVF